MQTARHHEDLDWIARLEPRAQAEVLAQLAQAARLVRLALDERAEAPGVARDFERALGAAMDADPGEAAATARSQLTDALAVARGAGLTVSATMSELSIDGALGAMRLPVLTARLSVARAAG